MPFHIAQMRRAVCHRQLSFLCYRRLWSGTRI